MNKRNPEESGRSYGGFLAMDKETTLKTEFRWARILVRVDEKKKPSSVNMLVGGEKLRDPDFVEDPTLGSEGLSFEKKSGRKACRI